MNRLQKKNQVEETGCSIMSSDSSILGRSDEASKDGEVMRPQNVKELGQCETFA